MFINIAHAAPAAAKVGVKAGVWDSVLSASLPVQLLLLVLIALSIVSWTIIAAKWAQFKSFETANILFVERFWKATSLESVYEKIADFPDSNIARVFKAAYLELQRIADSALGGAAATAGKAAPRLSGLDNLERALRKAVDTELATVESRLNFLATTGSTAPFIGLLGTVVGIMTSFSQIASTGSASLAVVAPGISEALFATAVGLFAAIPAVVAYNFYIGRVRRLEINLNNFSSDFLNIAKRNFFKE
ncbi:MAG: protein TolQ [Bdellovibrionaceae bacterium]|nr:protein TolQ [Pseudobdellovibrionaceae bacterium]